MQKICQFIFLLLSISTSAQKKYFQQDVNYVIDVTLNDKSHILRGFETLQYTNHSQDTLQFIFMHLWPNAYKNDRSAYCEQEVENRSTKFYYSKNDQRGFIDSLDFTINDQPVGSSLFNDHEDVILLELNDPLLPGKQITIRTPFRVVIPEVFSRLGHEGQAYQISQWYPKPAVYDHKGWHPLPYLDQGEFYSEIGEYTVNITLPENYYVSATGDLQTASEKSRIELQLAQSKKIADELLTSKSKLQDTFPASSPNLKTITFKQNHVHDFAWFADKRFLIEKTTQTLPSGKKTDCYAYFLPSHAAKYKGSSEVTAKTINYLSVHVGEYPYAQASIVDGTLIAGGGMEYPNVTVIGHVGSRSELRTVIIHEVGHNWFYGLLASNERDHPWMDEGINTYYEKAITDDIAKSDTPSVANSGNKLNEKLNGSFIYLLNAKQNLDQPINTSSTAMTQINYGGISYKKTAMMLAYLRDYLGADLFDRCMKRYYQEWHFKHPYPEDFERIFRDESGKNLDWFFQQGIQGTEKIDFKIGKIKTVPRQMSTALLSVDVRSKTKFSGPIPVNLLNGDSILATQWVEYPYTQAALFDLQSPYTALKINAQEILPEVNTTNNHYRIHGLFHRLRLQPRIGLGIGSNDRNDVYFLPAAGFNFYDKMMLGIAIHNLEIPNQKFQFAFAPMYALGSKSPVGTGSIGYSIFPSKVFQRILISVEGRSYHVNSSSLNIENPLFARQIKIKPSLQFTFRQKSARSTLSDELGLRYYGLWNEGFRYQLNMTDSLYRPLVTPAQQSHLFAFNFRHHNHRTFNPYGYELLTQVNDQFLKAGLTGVLRIDYHMPSKSLHVRAFAGKYFDLNKNNNPYNERQQYLNATYTGMNDFMYDESFLARSEQKGWMSQQVSMQEGGFKIRTLQYANPIGINDNWMLAVNLRSDLPFKLPLKLQLFLDAGTYAEAGKLNPSGNKAIFDGGVELHLLNDLIIVYAPLLMSKDFKDYTKSVYTKNRLLNTMSFSLNLSKINLQKTQVDIVKLFGY
ncbi:MAG: M1 family metallopeptidase [Chitinophagaceae bacterium]|nr:M1 family metallopeptidase [Chitinophagaceae bacterium]